MYRDPGPPPSALKVSITDRKFAKEPHDIHKEIRLLSTLSCPNVGRRPCGYNLPLKRRLQVIELLAHDQNSGYFRMWMPHIPHSLATLLNSASFTGFYNPNSIRDTLLESRFLLISKAILHQTLDALDYLHSRSIAHRDVKPSNVLLTEACQVKLIDFGIAWEAGTEDDGDLWPEPETNMYTEVATGYVHNIGYLALLSIHRPYRPPELLFGPKAYDAFATDMWSLGVTFADFFRPLKQQLGDVEEWDNDCEEEAEDEEQHTSIPFIFLQNPSPSHMTSWRRLPLFNADRGDIGLAWSIFKVRGTPNETNWPVSAMNPWHVSEDLILPLGLSVLTPR